MKQQNFPAELVIKLLAVATTRATIAARVIFILLIDLLPSSYFLAIVQFLLCVECCLSVLVFVLRQSENCLIILQSITHRLLPSVYAPPRNVTYNLHNHNHNHQLLQIVLQNNESRGGEGIETIPDRLGELAPAQVMAGKHGKFIIDGLQELTLQEIKNRLAAARSKQNPSKPSPAVSKNIARWENILHQAAHISEGKKSISAEESEGVYMWNLEGNKH